VAELSHSRRMLVLATCCLSLILVPMDNTVVNAALTTLHVQWHASRFDPQWTIDAYSLVLASALMLSGAMADRVGRKRVFLTGLAAFTLGSLLCELAPGLKWLPAFRMVQAIGGLMSNPVAMSVIADVFAGAWDRASAITATCAFGTFAGLLFASTLYLQHVRGYSPVQAGLRTLPLAMGILVIAPISGRIASRRGTRVPLICTLTATAALLLLFTRPGTPLPWLLAICLLFSVGFGVAKSHITGNALSGMPRGQVSASSAAAVASRQAGTALGVAVVGSALDAGLGQRSVADKFIAASHPVWLIIVGCDLCVMAADLIMTTCQAKQAGERTGLLISFAQNMAGVRHAAAGRAPITDVRTASVDTTAPGGRNAARQALAASVDGLAYEDQRHVSIRDVWRSGSRTGR
jgi:predicted MFS family arabinose efflux permease